MSETSSQVLSMLLDNKYEVYYRMCLAHQENGQWLLYSLMIDAIPSTQALYLTQHPDYYEPASFYYRYPSIAFIAGKKEIGDVLEWFDSTTEHYIHPFDDGPQRSLSLTFFTYEKQEGVNKSSRYFTPAVASGYIHLPIPHQNYEIYRNLQIQTIPSYETLVGQGPPFPNFAIAHSQLVYGETDWDVAQRMSTDARIQLRIATAGPFFDTISKKDKDTIIVKIFGEISEGGSCEVSFMSSGGLRSRKTITESGLHIFGFKQALPNQWHITLTYNQTLNDQFRYDSRDPQSHLIESDFEPEALSTIQGDYPMAKEETQEGKDKTVVTTTKGKFKEVKMIRVAVVSPGDVMPERRKALQIIAELNKTIAKDKGVFLYPYTWENDAYPGLHLKGAQGQVDESMDIEDCNIVIGIFWQRFGTPVEDAQSGTEHELRRALASWQAYQNPQIMLYFKDRSTNLRKIDPNQLLLVRSIEKEFSSYGFMGSFSSKEDFGNKLRNHLTQYLIEAFH